MRARGLLHHIALRARERSASYLLVYCHVTPTTLDNAPPLDILSACSACLLAFSLSFFFSRLLPSSAFTLQYGMILTTTLYACCDLFSRDRPGARLPPSLRARACARCVRLCHAHAIFAMIMLRRARGAMALFTRR